MLGGQLLVGDEFLRVVEQGGEGPCGIQQQDDGGGDHRAGQRAPAGVIDAGDMTTLLLFEEGV